MSKSAVFLNGPIGVGKTTLGRCLSERLAGAFIDGDDYADTSKAWYCSIKQTSQAIVRNGLVALGTAPVVVIAYPLTCSTWIYHHRKFSDAGVQTFFISLTASYESIIQPSRGREFTDEEHSRILTMIHEGYGSRPFSAEGFVTVYSIPAHPKPSKPHFSRFPNARQALLSSRY